MRGIRAIVGMFSDVLDFHKFFGANIGQKPAFPSQERIALRRSLDAEENSELWKAVSARDMVKVADGIGDSIYVRLGMAAEFGIPMDLVWDAIHRRNMTKGLKPHDMDCELLNSPEDNPARCTCGAVLYREDGKVLKPEGFVAPDAEIRQILIDNGWIDPKTVPFQPYDHTKAD